MSKGELWPVVNRNRPCPVCGKDRRCKVSPDGRAAVCARVQSGASKPVGEWAWLHRLDRSAKGEPMAAATPKTKREDGTDWGAVAARFAAKCTPARRVALARSLGLPDHGLDCHPLLGFAEAGDRREIAKNCYTFPEVDAAGRVVGVATRARDGKFFCSGGSRGLVVPAGFNAAECEWVFVVEGPTDVAAMWAAGLTALGRPSNSGGWELLGAVLSGVPKGCRIVVVGENDRKANGDWPGLHGAVAVAERLAHTLVRHPATEREPVRWALTPDGVKDVRAWLIGRPGGWEVRGRELAEKLAEGAVEAESQEKVLRKVVSENLELKRRMAAVEAMMAELLKNR